MDVGTRRLGRSHDYAPQRLAEWVGKHHMSGDPVAEERRWALAARAVENLVGHDHVPRPDRFLHDAAGADGQNVVHTKLLERVDIGACGHFGWQQPVPPAMSRQKMHRAVANSRLDDGVRGRAKGRV